LIDLNAIDSPYSEVRNYLTTLSYGELVFKREKLEEIMEKTGDCNVCIPDLRRENSSLKASEYLRLIDDRIDEISDE
ncbi:MAG: hypothetical protein AABW50_05690, partial [Nanoarchaeota archaeon]